MLTVASGLAVQVQAQFRCTTNNSSITITGYTGSGGAVTIPARINGLPVTEIAESAFYHRTNLTSITIPDGVTSIGSCAFYFCTDLTSVRIPNSVTNIGSSAFYFCIGLTSVTIPDSVTSIGHHAFKLCTGLTSVKVPGNVAGARHDVFYFCDSLTNVTTSSSVNRLADSKLNSYTILPGIYRTSTGPSPDRYVFSDLNNTTVHYLPGWGTNFAGRPTVLRNTQLLPSNGNFGVWSNQFGFTITGSGDLVIVVEACTNLANPIWSPVGTNTLTDGSTHFSDPGWTNYPARFYRLRSL